MPEKVIFDAVLAHGSDAGFRKEEDENGFRFTIYIKYKIYLTKYNIIRIML